MNKEEVWKQHPKFMSVIVSDQGRLFDTIRKEYIHIKRGNLWKMPGNRGSRSVAHDVALTFKLKNYKKLFSNQARIERKDLKKGFTLENITVKVYKNAMDNLIKASAKLEQTSESSSPIINSKQVVNKDLFMGDDEDQKKARIVYMSFKLPQFDFLLGNRYVIVFKDGNSKNRKLENLEIIDSYKEEVIKKTSYGMITSFGNFLE